MPSQAFQNDQTLGQFFKQLYKRLLVAPFLGTTQLCPSLGWTRLLAHGIPTMAEDV